jgi:hypothetical protein
MRMREFGARGSAGIFFRASGSDWQHDILEVHMRFLLTASLLAGILAAPLAATAFAADKSPNTQSCWHPAIVNGMHIQPGSGMDPCASHITQASGTSAKGSSGKPIDADDAYIRDILVRYQDFHIEGLR